MRSALACAAAAVLALAPGPGCEAQPGAPAFTPEQRRQIESHGPWPSPWTRDATNRVSGDPHAIALGRRLLFDARLSPSGRVSCSSCHRPERDWTDGRPVGVGLAKGTRNTPSLLDVRLSRWLGWGGGGDSLWMQSLRPILDPGEMGSGAAHVARLIGASAELSRHYAAAFARAPREADAETVLVDAAKALAAYQETIVSGLTTFDVFRDALAAGDAAGAARYPAAAARGLALFIGKGGCGGCHAGPSFTTGELQPARIGPGRRAAPDDTARLLASPYNLAGRFNDDPARSGAAALAGRAGAVLRVPTLRNVARTGPYMHDGSVASLRDAVRHSGPALSAPELADLLAFVGTLSTPAHAQR